MLLSSVFFFFKQKTAYEMRISDWSSDVCSSDLQQGPRCPRPEGLTNDRLPGARHYSVTDQTAGKDAHCQHRPASDRKSVAYGKRVHVRVDLGGRRTINKNTSRMSWLSLHTFIHLT